MNKLKDPGTKCGGKKHGYVPETLGQLYESIRKDLNTKIVNKPLPGQIYIKLKRSRTSTDMNAFNQMPDEITITQPPRLYRSTGWKYKGKVHLQSDLFWKFQFKFCKGDQILVEWMPVACLSHCYDQSHINQLKLF